MHLLHQLIPIGFLDVGPWMIGAIIPVAGLIFAGVIVVSAMYFKHQQRLAWHQTARLALEKGVPLPPMPSASEAEVKPAAAADAGDPVLWQRIKREQQQRNDVRSGLILVACGVGLFLMLRPLAGEGVPYVGAIPGLIGLALFLHGIVDRALTPKKD